MVGAGQGIGVAREIEDPPTIWISFSYGERGARTRIIWKGKDPPRTRSAMDRLWGTAEEGVEVDFPEIAQSDGTARTHMKATDGMKGGVLAWEDELAKMFLGEMKRTHMENIGIMEGGFAQIFENIFSKMDVREMIRTHIKNIGIMAGELLAQELEDKFSKMDVREMIRTHMKDTVILDDGTFSQEFEDILYKMYVPEMKSAYLRANVMLLTNALAPVTTKSSSNSTRDYNFYLDSGASLHMVFDPALLINLREPPSGTGQFRAADGSLLSVAAYGDIIMENFRIPDVYLVHELTVNLISVGQLAINHKVSSCFAGNECNLMLSGGKQIGGAIRGDDNQYILRFLEIE